MFTTLAEVLYLLSHISPQPTTDLDRFSGSTWHLTDQPKSYCLTSHITPALLIIIIMVIMMSIKAEEEADKDVCANCGIAEVDEIKLQECHDCDLVKYCSEKCRGEHRQQHHEDCKKRADELHDKRLFTQPEGTHLGECPICFLQIAHGIGKSTFMSCCSQWICRGCHLAHKVSNINDKLKASTCLFCRASVLDKKEFEKRKKERIEANDPAALCYRGTKFYQSDDYDKAIEYWTKASELGD